MTGFCNIRVDSAGALINGELVNAAKPVDFFHQLMGLPSRVLAAGAPAPAGHRNNQIHCYDDLGITLNEHHYTYQIHSILILANY